MKNIPRFALIWVLLLVIAAAGCGHSDASPETIPPTQETAIADVFTPTQPTDAPTEATQPAPTGQIPVVKPYIVPTQPTTPSTTQPTEPEADPPIFGVDESYFNDALFIGDSRTVGMRDAVRLGSADYFCQVGMSVFTMFNESVSDVGFTTQSLESLLYARKYGKIYIALGINGAGEPLSSIRTKFSECITRIRSFQPDAIIVLQGVITVGRSKAASDSCFRPEHLDAINLILSSFADGKTVFYIDPNEVYADSEGYLPDEYSADGCHLYSKYYEIWARFICDHYIAP